MGIEPSLLERLLAERRAFLLLTAIVVLVVGAGLTLFVSKRGPFGGTPGAPAEPETGSAVEEPPPTPVDAPWPTASPGEVLVRGTLGFEEGLPSPAGAVLVARTDRVEVDFPDTVAKLGGIDALRRLDREGDLEAAVRGLGGWAPRFRATAREDGSFGLLLPRDLPPFRFEVECDFGAYGQPEWFDVHESRTLSGVTLRLEPAGKIEGHLKGPGGAVPRSGFVLLLPLGESASGEEIVAEALADAQGRFAFRGALAGEYEIVAVAEGCAPSSVSGLRVAAGRTVRVEVPLRAESVLSGRVGDAQGQPVSNGPVRLFPATWAWSPQVYAALGYGRGRTDEKGRFRLRSLRPGVASIVALAQSHGGSKARSVEVPEVGELHGVDLWCEGGTSLTGYVVGPRGSGISDAEVLLESSEEGVPQGELRRWIRADRSGTFRFDGIPPGPFLLLAKHDHEGAVEVRGTAPVIDSLHIALPGPTGVQGRVRDGRTQVPIGRFSVRLVRHRPFEEGIAWEPLEEVAFESPDGSFVCSSLAPGSYELEIRAPGYATQRTSVFEVSKGEVVGPLSLPLERGASIRGKVRDGLTGGPVAGAAVRLVRADGRPLPGGVRRGDPRLGSTLRRMEESVRSRSDGSFEFWDVAGGTVHLEARHPKLGVTETVPFEATDGQVLENVALTYSRGGAVDGFAFGRDGRPMAGGAVTATPRESSQGVRREAITAAGYFRIEGLAGGDWRIQVAPLETAGEERWRPRAIREVDVRVEVGRIRRVEFPPLPEGKGRLRGRVALGAKPLSGCWVSVHEGAEGEGPAAETGRDGGFVVEGVPAGNVLVRVELPSAIEGPSKTQAGFETVVRVREGAETFVDLRLPQGRVEGMVTRAANGSPVPGAIVEVWPDVGPSAQPRARALANANGRFHCETLSAGPFLVRVFPPPGESNLADFELHGFQIETQGVTPLDVRLVVCGGAKVEVVGPNGKPVRGADVTLLEVPAASGDVLPFPRGRLRTDAEGRVRFERLRPGEYLAVADAPGNAPAVSEPFPVSEQDERALRLQLQPGVELRLRVGDEQGERVEVEAIQVVDEAGKHLPIPWRSPAEPPETLGTRITHLAPGVYTITVRASGYRPSTARVRLVEGLPFELPIVLRRDGSGG